MRPPDDFDPLDEVHIHRKLASYVSSVINVVVDPVPIQQKENSCVVISRSRESAHAHVGIIPVVNHVEPAHASQNVGQCPIAIFLNLFRRDHGYGSGRIGGLLKELRGSVNRLHLHFARSSRLSPPRSPFFDSCAAAEPTKNIAPRKSHTAERAQNAGTRTRTRSLRTSKTAALLCNAREALSRFVAWTSSCQQQRSRLAETLSGLAHTSTI